MLDYFKLPSVHPDAAAISRKPVAADCSRHTACALDYFLDCCATPPTRVGALQLQQPVLAHLQLDRGPPAISSSFP
jgi:hypothetical protein